jgi:hypothetical protein
MLPRICQPKKNREVVNMYSESKLGMEAIRRTAVEDFPRFASSAASAMTFSRNESGVRATLVIAGLDPAIHHSSKMMDTRVKPAYDDRVC